MQQVKLTYTPIGGASTDLTIDVIAVHGAAEPDALELFPGVKHSFLDGSLSEQIAGGRRNIEVDFGPKVSAANRRNLVNFWLSSTKTLTCVCATPGTPTGASAGPSGALVNASVYLYKVTDIDAIGESVASAQLSWTVSDADHNGVTLSWTGSANRRCSKIYRKKDAGAWKLLDYTTALTYTDMGALAEASLIAATPPVAASTISVVNASGQFSITWLNETELGRSVKLPLSEAAIFTTFPV